MASDADTVLDTTNCESEPIRFSGAVQPYGALLVVGGRSGVIEAASESCTALLGADPGRILGQPLQAVLDASASTALSATRAGEIGQLVRAHAAGRRVVARASLNDTGDLLVDVEADETGPAAAETITQQLREGVKIFRGQETVAEITDVTARLVRSLTAFEQVMVYRFDHDWNGEVVAESHAEGVESYLGLHYPASDIPRQARDLFHACQVRLIADVGYSPSRLIARGAREAIDLGRSSVRSVSPIHIQYLKNMGATATLVGALVVGDRLWGLISCQHKSGPRYLDPWSRDAVAWLCTDIAVRLEAAQSREARSLERSLAARRRQLVETIRTIGIEQLLRPEGNDDLLGVVAADGFALVSGSNIQTTGLAPELATITEICRRKAERHPDREVYASHALREDLGIADAGDGVAGALFVAVDRHPALQMIWFRRERSQSVRWAGDPRRPHVADEKGYLTPRQSFAQFLQEIRGQSVPWAPAEIDSAIELRNLIDIEALREREAFSQTVLNSISEHISVLDRDGFIVKVNDPWKRFAEANGAKELAEGTVGLNYRNICNAAAGMASGAEAAAAWDGIEAVIAGRLQHFTLDYPCDSPGERRWFRMTVDPLLPPAQGAIVAHQNVTQRKLAELALAESERRLQMSAEAGEVGLWELDLATGEAWHTPQHEKVVNLSVGDGPWSMQRMLDQVAAEDRPRVERAMAHGLVSGQFAWEARVVGSDGVARWISVKGSVMHRAPGVAPRLVGTAQDISLRKKIESGLKLQEEILRNMQEGVCLVSVANGKIVFANPKLEAIFGYGPGELVGKHVSVLNAPTGVSPEATAAAIMDDLADRGVWTGEVRNIRKDGTPFWGYSVVSTLEHEEFGTVWLAVHQDISSRKAVEEELARVQRLQVEQLNADLVRRAHEAEVANHAKTTFLAMMSHELRTPLNAMMGMTGLVQTMVDDPKAIRYLTMAQEASKHLLGIIADILDIAHIESQKLVLAENDFTLAEVLNRVVGIHEKTAADAKLGFTVEVDRRLAALPLRGDPLRLGQVLSNLIGNAIKFTPSGAVTVRVAAVEGQGDEECIRFEVQDSGVGISEDSQRRLFKPFEQLDMSLTRPFAGTGLGLGIAYRLVELMGGEIGVRSAPGEGSTFWFTARFRKGDAGIALADPNANAAEVLLRQLHGGSRVLLVEDDELNRFFATEQLRQFGLIVDAAELGEKAIDLASRNKYAAILMDVKMPVMDGIEATRRIRATAAGASTPILAITALAFPSDKARCIEAGMNDYLAKPIDRLELARVLLKWMRPTY